MRRPDYNAGVIGLLAAILDGIPSLPDAACRGRSELFDPIDTADPTAAYRSRAAAAICASCPVADLCPESRRPARQRKDTAA